MGIASVGWKAKEKVGLNNKLGRYEKMKVSNILTIVMFLVALLGSIGATSYYYTQTNKVITMQVYEHLESVSQSRGNYVESFLEEQKEKSQILSLETGFVNFLKVTENHKDYNELLENVQQNLDRTLESGLFLEVDLWDTEGVVLASTTRSLIGTDYSELDFYKKGKESTYMDLYYNPTLNIEQTTLGVVSPIIEDNELLGLIAISLSLEKLNTLMVDKTGIGETGETYLVNREGYAISPLLFVEDAVLKWKIDSVSSRNCFGMKDITYEGYEAVEIYLNYHGEKAIGTHYPIPLMDWCLIGEIDESEVLGKQRVLFQKTALIIIIVMVIIMTLVSFAIGKFIDKRVILRKMKKSL